MTNFLLNFFTHIILSGGYGGLAFLMSLESMVAPVPSEAVMPFAGFLWFSGQMSFWAIVFFSTLGSLIGSLISYYIGLFGGRPLVERFGKYFFLKPHHLAATEKFFQRFGEKAIFFGRFVPIVRHLISLPAGVGKMNQWKFIFYTVLGAGLWNAFLAGLGYYLGSRWEIIRQYGEALDFILVILIIAVIIFWFYRQVKNKKKI